MSGSGTGKGLLLRCICAIAFGQEPAAITVGHSSSELDKRIVSAVTEFKVKRCSWTTAIDKFSDGYKLYDPDRATV